MRFVTLRRAIVACAMSVTLALPAAATVTSEPRGLVGYLNGATAEDAAEYLAYLIRAFGCEVRPEDRASFNAAILEQLSFEFTGAPIARDRDGDPVVPRAVNEGLFAFSYRAGPLLLERGDLVLEADGTARLVACNALLS